LARITALSALDHLQQIAAPTAESEQVAAERIAMQEC
jgi:hypothetical protein